MDSLIDVGIKIMHIGQLNKVILDSLIDVGIKIMHIGQLNRIILIFQKNLDKKKF